MNKTLIISVLLPILIIIGGVLGFFLYRIYFRYRRDQILRRLLAGLRPERLMKLDADISRIEIITKYNKAYTEVFNELDQIYGDLTKMLINVQRLLAAAENAKYTEKHAKFNANCQVIRVNIEHIDDLENRFNKLSAKITNEDNFLRSEFSFFQSALRTSREIFLTNPMLEESLSPQLKKILAYLGVVEKQLDANLTNGILHDVQTELSKYSVLVKSFFQAVDEGPAYDVYLSSTIPALIAKLRHLHELHSQQIPSITKNNEFLSAVDNVERNLAETVNQFHLFKFKRVRRNIISMFKMLRTLERGVELELSFGRAFTEQYPRLKSEVEKLRQHCADQQKKVADFEARKFLLSSDVKSSIQELASLSLVMEERNKDLNIAVNDQFNSYISRITKCKMLLIIMVEMASKFNRIAKELWSIESEIALAVSKSKQINQAILDVMAIARKNGIKITEEEMMTYRAINDKLREINERLGNEMISRDTVLEMGLLEKSAIAFNETIGGRARAAEIVRNLIREFSPTRALNHNVDAAMRQVESLYFKGKYYEALNMAIGGVIEERRRSV